MTEYRTFYTTNTHNLYQNGGLYDAGMYVTQRPLTNTYADHMAIRNDFASYFKVALALLEKAINKAKQITDFTYTTKRLSKGNGKYRIINIPSKQLKVVQQLFLDYFDAMQAVDQLAAFHSFRIKKSTKTNALVHSNKVDKNKVIIRMDIKEYFDNCSKKLVIDALFEMINVMDKYESMAFYNQEDLTKLAYEMSTSMPLILKCLTLDGKLPQGASTSPIISNYVLRQFDDVIASELRHLENFGYSRYADDICVSFSSDKSEWSRHAYLIKDRVIVHTASLGLEINPKKTKVLHDGKRMNVTGVCLNERPFSYSKKLITNLRVETRDNRTYALYGNMVDIESSSISFNSPKVKRDYLKAKLNAIIKDFEQGHPVSNKRIESVIGNLIYLIDLNPINISKFAKYIDPLERWLNEKRPRFYKRIANAIMKKHITNDYQYLGTITEDTYYLYRHPEALTFQCLFPAWFPIDLSEA